MSGFDQDWLGLREPHDHAARSADLADRFAAALGDRPRLVDLGAGTGSNLRYLVPRLGDGQDWLLLDHDPALAQAAPVAIQRWAKRNGWSGRRLADGLRIEAPAAAARVRFRRADIRRGWPESARPAGITASALLDLASAVWLDRFARWSRGLPVLIALSVDGRLEWDPEQPEDETIRRRFLEHQRRDKGFGPALGADAAGHLASRMEALGDRVELARADWRLGSEDAALLGAMLDGIVEAAGEIADDPLLGRWAEIRRRQLRERGLGLTVGHVDLLALPA